MLRQILSTTLAISLALSTTLLVAPEAKADSWYYVCTQSTSLNMRSGPGTNYPITGQVAKGMTLQILSVQNGFARVITRTNVVGYVSVGYLCKVTVY